MCRHVSVGMCVDMCVWTCMYYIQDEFCLAEPIDLLPQLQLLGVADKFMDMRSNAWRSLAPGCTHSHRGARVHCCSAGDSFSSVAAQLNIPTVPDMCITISVESHVCLWCVTALRVSR